LGFGSVFAAYYYYNALGAFENKTDPMPIDLTYLSYLMFDKEDGFKIYKFMYGLDDKKQKALEQYLAEKQAQYRDQGYKLDFINVGKGMFKSQDSSGMVLASRCQADQCDVKIAFRGTRSIDDWGNNLDFAQVLLRFADTRIDALKYDEKHFRSGVAHAGFLRAYNTVAQVIADYLEELRRNNPNKKFMIRIGGHSLGGSLATLCAAHLSMNFKQANDVIQLETYGSPRTLGVSATDNLVNLLRADNIIRFVNFDQSGSKDIITDMPLESFFGAQYKHVGDACYLIAIGPDIYEGVKEISILRTPHRIEGYQAAYNTQKKCAILKN